MSRQETLAMLKAGIMPARYQRNAGTIGICGQLRLLEGKVAVVGAGGLGGNVIELLTRLGVGYLKIIDGDVFADHNLNRQLLCTEENLGMNKAEAAVKRVAAVNSDVVVEAFPYYLNEENAAELLSGAAVAVDALDNILSRRLLSQTAEKLGIPMVYGAIAGFTGQVTTLLPGDSLVGIYKSFKDNKGIETVLGNPAPTPALAAALQAQEVVKLLTGTGELLHKELLYFDTEFNIFERLKFSKQEDIT
ncbi:MAG: ThiF family adenylyltransferase [Pelosinus sp.]|nr:ThiF family adenylyltransferase [Pelosinus sp.]